MHSSKQIAYALFGAALVTPLTVSAGSKQWLPVGQINQRWDLSENWSPAGHPETGDDVYLTQSGSADSSVIYIQSGLTPFQLNSVTVNSTGTGTMLLKMNTTPDASDMRVTTATIGDTGGGQFEQDNGTNTAGTLYLGRSSGGTGSYTMYGGTTNTQIAMVGNDAGSEGVLSLTAFGSPVIPTIQFSATGLHVGYSGSGYVWQDVGTMDAGKLTLGENAGGVGEYNFSDGLLNADGITVGHLGTGTLRLTDGSNTSIGSDNGGQVTISGDLSLGRMSGGQGTLTEMGGNSLSARYEYIGYEGTGTFTQEGGSNTATSLYVGYNSSTDNTYTLKRESSLTLTADVGVGVSGKGTFTQSGGTHSIGGTLYVGQNAGANGTYNLNNSTTLNDVTLSAAEVRIGDAGTGAFNQAGGQLTVTGGLYVGFQDATGHGSYTLSASPTNSSKPGSLSAHDEYIGYPAVGEFTQNGVTNQTTHLLIGGNGTYTQNGGYLVVSGQFTNNGTFNQTGGIYRAGLVPLTGSLQNNHTFNVGGDAYIHDATNAALGTIRVNAGLFAVDGTFTNDGAYISAGNGPADNSNSRFNNIVINPTGYLVGGNQDTFEIQQNFTSSSTQNTLWDTDQSVLLLINLTADTTHQLSITGTDLGQTYAGYADNFAWDAVLLGESDSLTLLDGNTAPGGALYTHEFVLADGLAQLTSINSNGLSIYYDPAGQYNGYLNGQTYALNGGGVLAPVPEPASLTLFGLGGALLGLRRRRRT